MGRFPRAMPFGPRDDDSDDIAVGDLDRDGHLDVVVGNTSQPDRVFFGDGKGGFSCSVTFGGGTDRTRAVAIGDIDGDGHPDVVVGYESRDVIQAGGDGTMPTPESRGQVLFLYRLRNEVNQVYLNDGRGNLRPGPTFGAPGAPTRAIALGDVDGDGRLDIVVGNDCTENAIYLNRKLLSR